MNASCEHFSAYYKDFGPTAFNIIHGIFSSCVSQEARRQKVKQSNNKKKIRIRIASLVFTFNLCERVCKRVCLRNTENKSKMVSHKLNSHALKSHSEC